ncbi:MAG: UDP-4-amino-4-deoxy-L-arabinose aminotransferase [Chromatiales bacterium]|nr:UDP-4-amino-4-deoxy-L-arabinose aminotransferase [Chromatiales bacterium]
MPFLPFSRPSITQADIDAVVDVLRSGWITTGPKCAVLEDAFRTRVGAPHAAAVTSATAAMHLLFRAYGIGPGDEIITPSMTWVSTVNLAVLSGATPVFADIDRDTLMVTAAEVDRLCTPRTRLIIPVHMAGASLDLRGLREVAVRRGIPLIEDAAHAAGTEFEGVPVGRDGTSIFSFHPIKNMTTGEGGMLCTDDAQLAEHFRRLRFHGLGVNAFDRETLGRSPQAEVLEPGYKYNLPDMNAVLGLSQLTRLDAMNERRAVLARRYLELLSTVDEVTPLGLPGWNMRHSWHLFIVQVDIDRAGMSRDEFMQRLKDLGIGTGIHFRAIHEQQYYRELMPQTIGTLPNTEWNSRRICSLPLFPDMEPGDVDRVVAAIKSVLSNKS